MDTKNKDKAYMIWGIAACVYVIVFFHRVATGVVKDEMFEAFGLTNSEEAGSLFALLGSMYMYAYMFMQIPTGILADTLGPRKTITMGTMLATVGSLIFACAPHIVVAFIGRFLVGIGVAVVFVCILKIIAEWFPKEKFGTMSGCTSFIGNLGAILAMAPLAYLNSFIGWRNSFLMISGITLILGILGWCFIKEREPVNPVEEMNVECNEWSRIWEVIKKILKDRALYPIMIAYALTFGSTMALTGTWGVSMFQDLYKGISKTTAANAMSFITLGVAVGGIIIGKLSDTMKSRRKPMILFGGMQLICWLIVVFIPMPWIVLNIVFFILGLTATSFVVSWAYAKERHPKQYAGITMSVVNFTGFLGGAIVPQLIGVVYDKLPHDNMQMVWQTALGVLTGLISIAFVCILCIPKEKEVEQENYDFNKLDKTT